MQHQGDAGPHECNVSNDLTQTRKEKTEVTKCKLQQRWGTNVASESDSPAQGWLSGVVAMFMLSAWSACGLKF